MPLIVGDAAPEETLRAASIDTCKALVVVSTDDVTNLQAALNARAVRGDMRVVLRLFDDDFAQRVQTAFNINISRSVSWLAAPAFAAAMLDRDVLATIPVDRHALLVAGGAGAAGLAAGRCAAAARRTGRPSVRVIGMTAAGSEWVDWTAGPAAGCWRPATGSWWWPAGPACAPWSSRRRRRPSQPATSTPLGQRAATSTPRTACSSGLVDQHVGQVRLHRRGHARRRGRPARTAATCAG